MKSNNSRYVNFDVSYEFYVRAIYLPGGQQCDFAVYGDKLPNCVVYVEIEDKEGVKNDVKYKFPSNILDEYDEMEIGIIKQPNQYIHAPDELLCVLEWEKPELK